MTPARALFDWMPLVQIRRRIGVAAALYAGAHFLIYVLDQKWNLVVVATEIVKRFYLTIGFVALLVLVALAITSTDGWQKRLRRNWKRLHWLIYPAAVHRHRAFLHPVQGQDRRAGLRRRPVRLADAVARACRPRCSTRYLGLALLGGRRDPGHRGLRGGVVLAGERSSIRSSRPAGQPRSGPRPPARAESADRLAAGDRGRGAAPRSPWLQTSSGRSAISSRLYRLPDRRLVC